MIYELFLSYTVCNFCITGESCLSPCPCYPNLGQAECIQRKVNIQLTDICSLLIISLSLYFSSLFPLQDIHKSYLRTVPPYSHQAYVWADIVDFFGWKQVVVMTTSDQDGRSILTLLRRTLEDHEDMYKFEVSSLLVDDL